MKKKVIKLNNLVFPIWLLWLLPISWIVVLPANFLIDLLVIILTMKYIKVQDIKSKVMAIILKVWIFGFIADFIGTAAMLLSNLMNFSYETQFGKWWYDEISLAVSYDPLMNIYAILWVTVSVIIAAFFIYLFNYKFALKKVKLTDNEKKKLALSLAIFTAPYFFYIPTSWFFELFS